MSMRSWVVSMVVWLGLLAPALVVSCGSERCASDGDCAGAERCQVASGLCVAVTATCPSPCGACRSCVVSGSDASCVAVAMGEDPAGDCVPGAGCNGEGACCYGLELDANRYVTVAPATGFSYGETFTAELWLNWQGPSGNDWQFFFAHGEEPSPRAWRLAQRVDPFVHFTIASAGTNYEVVANTSLTQGAWQHLAGVYDHGELRLYLDGILLASSSGAVSPGAQASALPAVFGHSDNAWAQAFIDEARVSSVARYVGASFVPERFFTPDPDTLGLWHFDEGKGTLVADASGNGHDGQVTSTGDAWSANSACQALP